MKYYDIKFINFITLTLLFYVIFQVHNIDAIHPGYGFLSERSDFAAACEANDIKFIGPRAQVMAKMGDKVSARQSALDAGLPIIPGTDTALSDAEVIFLIHIFIMRNHICFKEL